MQKSSRIAKISTKVVGGGATFYVHPVYLRYVTRNLAGHLPLKHIYILTATDCRQ